MNIFTKPKNTKLCFYHKKAANFQKGGELVHFSNKDKKKKVLYPQPKAAAYDSRGRVPSDIEGSYTGVPYEGDEPTQDADDL